MATLKEISYDLLQSIQKKNVDDAAIDLRSIYFWVKNQRSIWVKNEVSKNHGTSHKFIQDLGSLAVSADGTYKKTEAIPLPIHVRSQPHITRVGHATISNHDYIFLPYESAKYHSNGKFNSGLVAAFYYNSRIYIKGTITSISTINVRGVFEDPMDVSGMTINSEYPIDEHLINYMKDEIIKLDIKQFILVPEDVVNDGTNS